MKLSTERARGLWARAQGLDERASGELADVCARTGWIRTLGGAGAYLGLAARVEGIDVARVRDAVAAGELGVRPSVRGCIYLVPRQDFALSLRIADLLSAPRNEKELKKAGATEAELRELGEAIVVALADGPRGTRELRKELPEGSVRSLGEAGKKVGITSTLPPALRRLEFAGRIERRSVDDRLDHESYGWAIPKHDPFSGSDLDDPAHVHVEIAKRFFAWAGPATRKELAAWAGIKQSDAKAAIAAADLVEVEVEALGGEAFAHPASLDEEGAVTRPVLLPALDNLFGLRSSAAPLVDEEHAGVMVSTFGGGGAKPIAECGQPLDRSVVIGGRIVGTWGYDVETGESELHCFASIPKKAMTTLKREARRADSILGELGHGRSYSLDNEASVTKRLERMRAR